MGGAGRGGASGVLGALEAPAADFLGGPPDAVVGAHAAEAGGALVLMRGAGRGGSDVPVRLSLPSSRAALAARATRAGRVGAGVDERAAARAYDAALREVPVGRTVKGQLDTLPSYHCSACLLYTSPSPRDVEESRMPSSA